MQSLGNSRNRDVRSRRYGVTISAGGDSRERQGLYHVLIGEPDALAMTTFQNSCFALIIAEVDGADRVNNIFRSQAASCRDHCLSRGQASNLAHDFLHSANIDGPPAR